MEDVKQVDFAALCIPLCLPCAFFPGHLTRRAFFLSRLHLSSAARNYVKSKKKQTDGPCSEQCIIAR